MKKILFAALLAASTTAAFAGVSVSIGQPGFYGQLDIGGFPPPQVIYQQPQAIYRVPVDRPPLYLRVPPGHAKNWRKHCRDYNACGERVYFVRDNWYNDQYVPRYQARHNESRGDHRDDRRDDRRDDHRDDHRDDRRGDHDNGNRGNDHRGDDRGRGNRQ